MKEVNTSISVDAVPTLRPPVTTVTVTGDLSARRGCARGRTVRFSYSSLGITQPIDVTAKSGKGGEFTAILPPPSFQPSTRNGTLAARVSSVKRKWKGRLVRCDNAREVQPIREARPPRP